MFDIRILYNAINFLKKSAISFSTNCFFNDCKLITLSEQDDTRLYVGKKSICLLYDEVNFTRLYYWITDLNAIQEVSDYVINCCNKKRDIIIELIGFDNTINEIERQFSKAGIKQYIVFNRWRTSAVRVGNKNNDGVICALIDKNDVKNVIDIIEENFDPYVAHLPTKEHLYELQNKQLIYGAYLDHNLVGVVCLEDIGLLGKYLHLIAVKKNCQGMGIGGILGSYALNKYHQCNNFVSWIGENNNASRKLHTKLGFKIDKLKTVVLIYETKQKC